MNKTLISTELQERMATTEAKLKEHFAELEDLKAQQAVVSAPLESPIEPPPKEQETVTDGVTETPTATNVISKGLFFFSLSCK